MIFLKKIIAMLVCVLMLAACLPTAAFAVDAGITTGDVNGDEAVDVKDVVLMIRFLTGWDVGISEEYGDFDGNKFAAVPHFLKVCVDGINRPLSAADLVAANY